MFGWQPGALPIAGMVPQMQPIPQQVQWQQYNPQAALFGAAGMPNSAAQQQNWQQTRPPVPNQAPEPNPPLPSEEPQPPLPTSTINPAPPVEPPSEEKPPLPDEPPPPDDNVRVCCSLGVHLESVLPPVVVLDISRKLGINFFYNFLS